MFMEVMKSSLELQGSESRELLKLQLWHRLVSAGTKEKQRQSNTDI